MGMVDALRQRIPRWAFLLCVAYLGVLFMMLAFENWLIFVGGREWLDAPNFPHEEVQITVANGVQIVGWHCPCPTNVPPAFGTDRPVVLYSHGNAGNLSHRTQVAEAWQRALGADVFMYDYRGYGKSGGRPTEVGLYQDGRAAYDWLVKTRQIAPQRIIIFGESLGGGVAVHLAGQVPCAALVLERSFTSLPDVAARHFPWLPVRWVMRNRFPSIDRIGAVTCPVFIASASRDEVVPFSHGKSLFEKANEPKRFFELSGLGHNDAPGSDYYQAVRQFVVDSIKGGTGPAGVKTPEF